MAKGLMMNIWVPSPIVKEVDMDKDKYRWVDYTNAFRKCIRDFCDCSSYNPQDFRVQLRVKEHNFKWTKESVAAVDWSKKSTVETLEASAEHWQERIDNFDVKGERWWDAGYCAACKRVGYRCGNCPLYSDHCCGCNHSAFESNPTIPNAQAVLDYINKILQQEREKEWAPELGEEVEAHDPPDSEWEGRQGTIIAFGVNNNGLLFNPCWTDGKSGWEGTHIIEGYPCVPGYPKSHMGFALSHLRPVRKCKK